MILMRIGEEDEDGAPYKCLECRGTFRAVDIDGWNHCPLCGEIIEEVRFTPRKRNKGNWPLPACSWTRWVIQERYFLYAGSEGTEWKDFCTWVYPKPEESETEAALRTLREQRKYRKEHERVGYWEHRLVLVEKHHPKNSCVLLEDLKRFYYPKEVPV